NYWFSVSAVKLGDGFVATYVDITRQKEAENLLSGVLNATLDGFIALRAVRDESGNIVDFVYLLVNQAAEQFMQRQREQLLGKRLFVEYPDLKTPLLEQYARVVETGEPLDYE